MTAVDTRLAGGSTTVEPAAHPYIDDEIVVRISFPGLDVALHPHEATALAAVLIGAAASAEALKPGTRPE